MFNQVLSLEEIMASGEVFDPLTRFQCCPPTCGAAAAILCLRMAATAILNMSGFLLRVGPT